MLSLVAALIASVAAIVCLILWLGLPPDAAMPRAGYCAGFVAAALLVALLSPAPPGLNYKAALLFGLILTLLALPLTQSRQLPDYVGHGHLLWAYIIYAYGLASLTAWTWPTPWLLLPLAAAAALYWRLFRHLADLWESILLYTGILVIAIGQAIVWVTQAAAAPQAWLALAALLVIAAAHTTQAFARFRHLPTRLAATAFPVLLAGQLLLSWSAWTWPLL
jgi:hypothetical protein